MQTLYGRVAVVVRLQMGLARNSTLLRGTGCIGCSQLCIG
jgi:hypothetical protein